MGNGNWGRAAVGGLLSAGYFLLRWCFGGITEVLGHPCLSTFDLVPLETYRQAFHAIPPQRLFLLIAVLLHFVVGIGVGACLLFVLRRKQFTRTAYLLFCFLTIVMLNSLAAWLFPAPGLLCWDCD